MVTQGIALAPASSASPWPQPAVHRPGPSQQCIAWPTPAAHRPGPSQQHIALASAPAAHPGSDIETPISHISHQASTVHAEWLGRMRYADAWDLQRRIFDEVLAGTRPNTFLLLEHPDVITLGRNARSDANLLLSRELLEANGYEVFDVDRGGDVTYHGPGQLVGYPIIRLADFREDLGWYMRSIEELIIRGIAGYGIEGGRRAGMSGVWTGERKICAIGVRASRWVTMHGFALNVTTDLSRFQAIVPCGIAEYDVTSIERETGLAPALEEVARAVVAAWDGVFVGREGDEKGGDAGRG